MEKIKVYALGFKVPEEEAYATKNGYIYWSVADQDFTESIECCLDFYSIDSVMNYYKKNRDELFEDYDTAVAIECKFEPKIVATTTL